MYTTVQTTDYTLQTNFFPLQHLKFWKVLRITDLIVFLKKKELADLNHLTDEIRNKINESNVCGLS